MIMTSRSNTNLPHNGEVLTVSDAILSVSSILGDTSTTLPNNLPATHLLFLAPPTTDGFLPNLGDVNKFSDQPVLSSLDSGQLVPMENISTESLGEAQPSKPNQKISYLVRPEDLGLLPPIREKGKALEIGPEESPGTKPKRKIGRPKKSDTQHTETEQTKQNAGASSTGKLHSPTPCCLPPQAEKRSRAGRTIRLRMNSPPATIKEDPNDMIENVSELLEDMKDKDYRSTNPINKSEKFQDKDAHIEKEHVVDSSSALRKPRIPASSVCATCKKSFLGRRLQRHYAQHPHHLPRAESNITESPKQTQQHSPTNIESSLFDYLMLKLRKSNLSEDQRADIFLHELHDLVAQLQARSSRLIRNTSGLHVISKLSSRVLGIPEGQYALDISALEATPTLEVETEAMAKSPNLATPSCLLSYDNINGGNAMTNLLPTTPTHCDGDRESVTTLDYNNMSLDATLTDEAAQKLNLNAGGKLLPPSEESLLRAVDDLVGGSGMKTLEAANAALLGGADTSERVVAADGDHKSRDTLIVSHYDHVSDNAVEAINMQATNTNTDLVNDPANPPLLDLPVDFFQFNNN